jgi:hypothetical protein
MKLISWFLLFFIGSFNALVHASDYTLVLVHGFQPGNLASRPNALQVTQNGTAYWSEFWNARADVRIDWPPHERIAARIATDYVWPKLRQMSVDGSCKPGCIFVTHSTGDLVTRYVLDNQALWLQNAGLEPLNIIATFDFAGAGGGTELADIAVNFASGSSLLDKVAQAALSLWLGTTPTPSNLGVLNDLRVNTARQIAPFPDSRVPRLRFAGAGSDYLGATRTFLSGEDDGVVPSHSSCGASTPGSFESCSRAVGFNGKITNQNSGVINFMPQHYPLLMGEKYSHSATIGAQPKGDITTANSNANYLNNAQIRFNNVDVKRGFWIFSSRYRVVTDSDRFSLSELVNRAAN